MTGPDPAVAAVRLAVRQSPAPDELEPGSVVLVACSGGADSLAVLAATVFEARRDAWHVVGVTVDHGLQPDSADRADRVAVQMAQLGAAETMTIRVAVDAPGIGPEAAAREARYTALAEAAQRSRSRVVLLGHTLDDQAETVLLGLARGSGGRSIAGMRRDFVQDGVFFLRPLLEVTRAQTEQACRAEGIEFWSDPHNDDPRFTRSRVRQRVMPLLEEELGPGIAAALARTADLLQEDLAALDAIARRVHEDVTEPDGGLDAVALQGHPFAVCTRVLRMAAVDAGCPPSELFRAHVLALGDLMFGGPGREVQLPGHVTARLDKDQVLRFRRTDHGVAG